MSLKSSFTTPLRVEFGDDTRWTLVEAFEFCSITTESIIRVPVGFCTDFASIPRVMWSLLPPAGPYGKAAVVHDWLYQKRDATTHAVWRDEADAVLLEGMEALKVGRLTRWTIYMGVRIGGWFVWNHYRREERRWL